MTFFRLLEFLLDIVHNVCPVLPVLLLRTVGLLFRSGRALNMGVVMSEDFEGVFLSQVLPDFVERSVTSDEPVLILLGGQPGSGKSTAVKELLSDRVGVHHLDGDRLRSFHPAFSLDFDGLALMPSLTDRAVGVWLSGLLDHAFQSGRSVLLEGTWWNAEQVLSTVSTAQNAGFKVEAHMLAVSPAESLVGVTERFLRRGHFTRLWKHDRAVAGLPVTLEGLLQADVGVCVRDRAGAVTGDPADVLMGVWGSSGERFEIQRHVLAERLRSEFPDDVDVQDIRTALLDANRFQGCVPATVSVSS